MATTSKFSSSFFSYSKVFSTLFPRLYIITWQIASLWLFRFYQCSLSSFLFSHCLHNYVKNNFSTRFLVSILFVFIIATKDCLLTLCISLFPFHWEHVSSFTCSLIIVTNNFHLFSLVVVSCFQHLHLCLTFYLTTWKTAFLSLFWFYRCWLSSYSNPSRW